jgi:hypothetical protein
MAEDEPTPARTDSARRPFVCEARSPDGAWRVQVFGPSAHHCGLYADVRHPALGVWYFPLGRELAGADQISLRWDLPNGSWGVFIDGECWVICAYRPAQRMNRHRILTRSGPFARPFTAEEIRFACAKRRGQRHGTRGFVVEE